MFKTSKEDTFEDRALMNCSSFSFETLNTVEISLSGQDASDKWAFDWTTIEYANGKSFRCTKTNGKWINANEKHNLSCKLHKSYEEKQTEYCSKDLDAKRVYLKKNEL